MHEVVNKRSRGTLLAAIWVKLLVPLACCHLAAADTRSAPVPRVFASTDGYYWVRVTPKPDRRGSLRESELTVTRSDALTGKEISVGTINLKFVPARVIVSNQGQLVCLNDYYSPGFGECVTVLGSDGVPTVRKKLENMLTRAEIRENVSETVSSRDWDRDACFAFSADELVITTRWGKRIAIPLTPKEVDK
ncbi:MAG: hypothetical protein SF069_14075 [Phycisphaerae bacterium]|nr:hypothetical protein [Phycisphaerae bacterium]